MADYHRNNNVRVGGGFCIDLGIIYKIIVDDVHIVSTLQGYGITPNVFYKTIVGLPYYDSPTGLNYRIPINYFSIFRNSTVKSQHFFTVAISSFSSGEWTPRRVGP